MSAIAITDDLFFNRAGLDRGKSERTVAEALKGGDDGELFLEYSQSEALAFDDGRLKSASFDATQGFGLRAVAGEAHGYAHASELSDAALQRAAATVKAVARRPWRDPGGAAAGHQPAPLYRRQSAGQDGVRRQGRAAGRRSTPMPAPRTRASGR